MENYSELLQGASCMHMHAISGAKIYTKYDGMQVHAIGSRSDRLNESCMHIKPKGASCMHMHAISGAKI